MRKRHKRMVKIGLNDVGTYCILEVREAGRVRDYRGPFRTREEAEAHACILAKQFDYDLLIEHVEDKIT